MKSVKACDTCVGSGEVKDLTVSPPTLVPCPDCDGSGMILDPPQKG